MAQEHNIKDEQSDCFIATRNEQYTLKFNNILYVINILGLLIITWRSERWGHKKGAYNSCDT